MCLSEELSEEKEPIKTKIQLLVENMKRKLSPHWSVWNIDWNVVRSGEKGLAGRYCTLSSLMASSFFSSALVGSCHAVVNPSPLGEDGGLLPLIRRPTEEEWRIKRVDVATESKDRPWWLHIVWTSATHI